MKRFVLIISLGLVLALLNGCGNENTGDNPSNNLTPTQQPILTQPAQEQEDTKDTVTDTLKLSDYFPLLADIEYIYEGTGNEYAAFTRYTDFLDTENNRIQTRTNNGGTETVRVIEIAEGKVSVASIISECYYRDNLLTAEPTEANPEVLLMEPLVAGTEWVLPDGRRRAITGVEVAVETPSGSYNAIEVTSYGNDSTIKDYYASQLGLVKSIFSSGDMEVVSSLSEINKETPRQQVISIFYPDVDEKIYMEPLTLSFKTNDITRDVIAEALRQKGEKESYLPLASTNTKINSLYLGKDGIAYVDFSPELIQEMNAGAGYEHLILQSIANTLGSYYVVDQVYITVDNKPYESGHILMKKGETFKVNLEDTIISED